MPKCVKCNDFFPPNYTEVIEGSQPDPLDNNNYPQQCTFCKLGVHAVDVESVKDSGNYDRKYTKEECLRDYQAFLKKVHDSKNVQDILKYNQ